MSAALTKVYLENIVSVFTQTARVITDQGLDDFDTLTNFNEENMRTLYVTICHPRGLVPSPRAVDPGQPADICDPGHFISMLAKKCMILMSFTEKNQAQTSRPINATMMTRVLISSLSPLRGKN